MFRGSVTVERRQVNRMTTDREELVAENDPRLERLVREEGAGAESEIARVLMEEARPLVRQVISRYEKSGSLLTAEDAEDVAATVDIRLVEKLRAVTIDRRASIRDLHSYIATVAHNAVSDFLRTRFPEHTRLKKRLRYALTHDERFAMWPTAAGPACGLRAWAGRDDVLEVIPPVMLSDGVVVDVFTELFREAGKPVLVNALVDVLADASGVRERLPMEDAADQVTPFDARLEDRDFARALWLEIRQLQPMQRKALLLNLRLGGAEVDALAVLLLSGISRFADIAAALEMTEPELAGIWNDLPYDDRRIAGMLGVTRQQVINVRRAARERLSRRFRR